MTTRYHVEQDISAPAAKVWALLTDASSWKSWNPTVISIDGTIAVGQTVALVSTLNKKRTFKLKVTELSTNGTGNRMENRMVWSDGMPLDRFVPRVCQRS